MYHETKVAVAVLVDTSASVSPTDLRSCLAARRVDRGRAGPPLDARDSVCPVDAFARSSEDAEAVASAADRGRSWPRDRSGSRDSRGGRDRCLPGLVPRIALISDGKQNKGSVARAAWQAQQLGIPDRHLRAERAAGAGAAPGIDQPAVASRSRANNFPSTWWFLRPKAGPGGSRVVARKGARSARRRYSSKRGKLRCVCMPA